MIRASSVVLLAATLVYGASTPASPAGKWTGTIEVHDRNSGEDISTTVEIQLDPPSGVELSGKIGREGEDAVRIQHGRQEGNHITFEAANGETDGAMHFDLTVNGQDMNGLMKGSVQTMEIEGDVKLHRVTN